MSVESDIGRLEGKVEALSNSLKDQAEQNRDLIRREAHVIRELIDEKMKVVEHQFNDTKQVTQTLSDSLDMMSKDGFARIEALEDQALKRGGRFELAKAIWPVVTAVTAAVIVWLLTKGGHK